MVLTTLQLTACVYTCIEIMSVTANHIICKKIMHSLLLPYCEIKIYKNSYVTPTLHNNVHILL